MYKTEWKPLLILGFPKSQIKKDVLEEAGKRVDALSGDFRRCFSLHDCWDGCSSALDIGYELICTF